MSFILFATFYSARSDHSRRRSGASSASTPDSFDMISGTNGLLGAADGAFIMQRKRCTDNTVLLNIVGRDQPDQELTLEFNWERCVREVQGAEMELWKLLPDPLLEAVAKLLTQEHPEWNTNGTVGAAARYGSPGKCPHSEAECECRQALQ